MIAETAEQVRQKVLAMSPVERFLYWCEERHRIYLRRQDGAPKPWTDDAVLQTNYFTNTYRELDKTTAWFREHIRDPLNGTPDVLMATVIFRWFNYIQTGDLIRITCLHTMWDPGLALHTLSKIRDAGEKVFTGAFMINSPAGEPKLEAIIRRIDGVWKKQQEIHAALFDLKVAGRLTMAAVHKLLTQFDGLGGFMAYEIVCDLRFTHLLEDATDINTWANPGPGAIRGMYRVLGREIKNKSNATAPGVPPEWKEQIVKLRLLLQDRMYFHFGDKAPPVEAREVEMSLCEYDKYVRILLGEGKSKRTYNGA
jgi:hypothetical protein